MARDHHPGVWQIQKVFSLLCHHHSVKAKAATTTTTTTPTIFQKEIV
jgi:hypothetical protein